MKNTTDTLPNVTPDEAGTQNPPIVFLDNNSEVLQNSLDAIPQNLQRGVSSDYALQDGCNWYVLRITYGRYKKVLKILQENMVTVYVPMCRNYNNNNVEMNEGELKPLLLNIIFVYAPKDRVKEVLRKTSALKFYLDKTKERETNTSYHPPLVVPYHKMIEFIKLTSIDNQHIRLVRPENCHYKSGDIVEIIKGEFKGIEGKVVRAAGQQRVAIEIEGLCTVVTAYIPTDFMKKVGTYRA